ncbi:MAG TPA: hypothetical protein VJ927_02230 [Actinomycetota bacterium]|nr:hypothetical protein [Actinomycetota bacterium]
MNTKQLAIVSAIVGCVLAVIIVLLATGGVSPAERSSDPVGDVEVAQGSDPAPETTLADIRSARVRSQNGQIVFQAEMEDVVPRSLEDQTMEWRWEILEGGTSTWIVSANVSVGRPVASVTAQQQNFAASTIDDTLRGSVDHEGNTIFVRLDATQIQGFPTAFAWRLKTTLDGNRADPASALATDEAPGSGLGEYPPPD